MKRFRSKGMVGLLFLATWAAARGNQSGQYADQEVTGTTSAGEVNRKGDTINSTTGNAASAATPVGTDPTASPGNRNPYNDRNYRPGAPGTSVQGQTGVYPNPRASANDPNTLGTSLPATIPGPGQRTTPGLGATPGRPGTTGTSGAPAGNPGPIGSPQAPNPAPTTGGVGAGGSGASGIPGSISNAGTHGINGSGH